MSVRRSDTPTAEANVQDKRADALGSDGSQGCSLGGPEHPGIARRRSPQIHKPSVTTRQHPRRQRGRAHSRYQSPALPRARSDHAA